MNEQIDEKLNSREIKPTAMRELVLKLMMEKLSAISLPELEEQLSYADKATLYRTLKTFEKNKLIHSINDGNGPLKYALCMDDCECEPEELHIHFSCTVCNKTYCLNEIPVPKISLPKGFNLTSVETVVKGVCANCIS
ncbi:MAG: transcriptional repressor [Marinilabiliales bacterium]|nr:MAG: transcriptional repressor [Marinilabiliales bacterium]